MLAGAAPKYDMEGFEKCIDALEQNGVEGGKSIYDDYFTVISSGARETQIQFHRQQMEQDGWDVEKEQILFWGKMKWHPLHRLAETNLITHSR